MDNYNYESNENENKGISKKQGIILAVIAAVFAITTTILGIALVKSRKAVTAPAVTAPATTNNETK